MKDTTAIKLRSWLFAALAALCLFVSGTMLPGINRQRRELKLTGTGKIGDLPPAVVIAARTGGIFRALAINALWMRATELQQSGEVFELVQLYKWITALEPRFPMVWAYRAWNAAYNVSVKFPVTFPNVLDLDNPHNKPDVRWEWVQRGIETLRDEGIPWNPNAERLYRELAWIYNHKIGQGMDDAHLYYKIRLAHKMQRALGKPPYRETIERIAGAPETQEKLLETPAVASLVQELRQAGLQPFQGTVGGTDIRLAILNRSDALPEDARRLLEDAANGGAVAALDAFLRARYLDEVLKLKPDMLLRMMERYGPIDWRLPDAHALYWTHRAFETMPEGESRAANTARVAFHALTSFYRRGRLTFRYDPEHPEQAVWRTDTNFAFMERAVNFHEALYREYKGTDQGDPLREGLLNFLREVVLDLYLHNDVKRSRQYYEKLQSYGPEADIPYLEFITQRFLDRMEIATYEQNISLVKGVIFEALRLAAVGETEQAVARENLARLIRRRYNARGYRYTIPPIDEFIGDVFIRALRVFPDEMVDRLEDIYPNQVEKARKALEELRRNEQEGAAPKQEGT
jgi:hypothetical protein